MKNIYEKLTTIGIIVVVLLICPALSSLIYFIFGEPALLGFYRGFVGDILIAAILLYYIIDTIFYHRLKITSQNLSKCCNAPIKEYDFPPGVGGVCETCCSNCFRTLKSTIEYEKNKH